MILRIALDLPGDGTYLRIARRIGHTLMGDLGVVPQDIADIKFISVLSAPTAMALTASGALG